MSKQTQSELMRIQKIIKQTRISAFNKAVKSGYSRMEQFVRQRYALKKKDISEVVHIVKANDIESPVARIEIKSKGIPLLKFAARQIGKWTSKRKRKNKSNPDAGTKATIYVGERKLFKEAFISKMKYGENVFLRSSKDRGSVFALYGTKPSSLFSSQDSFNVLEKETTEQFAKIFIKDLNYKLGSFNNMPGDSN